VFSYKGKLDILIIYDHNSDKIFSFYFFKLFCFPICLVGEWVIYNWLCISLEIYFLINAIKF